MKKNKICELCRRLPQLSVAFRSVELPARAGFRGRRAAREQQQTADCCSKMEKKYILALTKEPVDLSAFPEARVGPPGSPPPPSIGQVVLPRLARRLCEEFPEFEVLPGCNKEDFESKIEMTQKVRVRASFAAAFPLRRCFGVQSVCGVCTPKIRAAVSGRRVSFKGSGHFFCRVVHL